MSLVHSTAANPVTSVVSHLRILMTAFCILAVITGFVIGAVPGGTSPENGSNTQMDYPCSATWSKWMIIPRTIADLARDVECIKYQPVTTCSDERVKCTRRRNCACNGESQGRFISDPKGSCTQLANCLWPVCCASVKLTELRHVVGRVLRVNELGDSQLNSTGVMYLNVLYVPSKWTAVDSGGGTPMPSESSLMVKQKGTFMNHDFDYVVLLPVSM
ncbi:unnamed protein product [Dicrocoelium dendriticum]|nr:unnamed protein product [Dicrocoelium dendriticum]